MRMCQVPIRESRISSHITSYTFWISIGHQTSMLNWTGSKLKMRSEYFQGVPFWSFELSTSVCLTTKVEVHYLSTRSLCIQWVHIGKGNTPKALKQLILATDVHRCPAIPSPQQPIDEYVVGTGRFQATERNRNSMTCHMQRRTGRWVRGCSSLASAVVLVDW